MRTEVLGNSKNSSDPIGSRTRDLLFCGAEPQPTASPPALVRLIFLLVFCLPLRSVLHNPFINRHP